MSPLASRSDRLSPPAARRVRRVLAVAAGTCALLALTAASPQTPAPSKGIQPDLEHPVLAIGSPAPDFALPGVDGKTHRLSDYASAKILAIVFECNHCPTSQLYEDRIKQLYEDYRPKGVTLVAINPNNPNSVRLGELGYTDVMDSLAEMKVRVAYRHLAWPYLYDGATQSVSIKFGVVATPHIFIFDQDRKLRYQGRIDDSQRADLVKTRDARNALDAMLAGKPVPVAETRAFGCSTKWIAKSDDVEQEMAKIKAEPVTLDTVGPADLKALRASAPGKVLLVNFWSTGCRVCTSQFNDFETTYRMYRLRAFNLVTVATTPPATKAAVLAFLEQQHASSPNKLFGSADTAALEQAWGATWNPQDNFTVVIGTDGKILFAQAGKIDIVQVRRVILAAMPDTSGYIGSQAYWSQKSS